MKYDKIYKLLTKHEWEAFVFCGRFAGTPLDIKSGFIHLSKNLEQVNRIKNKYYPTESVMLLFLNKNKLCSDKLKYEMSSSGDIYPHFYGDLEIGFVIEHELI